MHKTTKTISIHLDLFQMDNALSLIKIGALENGIENTSLHDLIYLSKFRNVEKNASFFNFFKF